VTDTKVKCWGSNINGQLGDGTTTRRITPVEVPGITTNTDVALGNGHTCALTYSQSGDNGSRVKCWGSNEFGQLGDGSTITLRTSPVEVSNITTASSIALGQSHSCALLMDGTVKCWGDARIPGKASKSNTPVEVSGFSYIVEEIALGGQSFSCAMERGSVDKVKCWGNNQHGQLGDGTTKDTCGNSDLPCSTIVEVSGLTNVLHIALGDAHSCALIPNEVRLLDGKIMCWGYNANGQLGDGTTTRRLTPVQVSGITTATRISLGVSHSCAVLTDGKVKCWGSNANGQLGDGTTSDSRTPVEVFGILTATRIALGGARSCAELINGKVMCWGSNMVGQIGDGTTQNNRLFPIEIPPPPSLSSASRYSIMTALVVTIIIQVQSIFT